MLKKDLRLRYKALRKNSSEETLENGSLAIANKLLEMPIWDKQYYHLFLSITEMKEINTAYILQILAGKDKEVVVSKTHIETRQMEHFRLTENTRFRKNSYNIPEPVEDEKAEMIEAKLLDVVFVPLLAYDTVGNRVGYGKGYYDVFLSQCRPDTVKIGLSLFEPEAFIDDVTPNDIRLDFCVTPEKIYAFRNRQD